LKRRGYNDKVIESGFSKAIVTRILDTLIENAVNHSKIVATEIIDNILKGAVKTDNNSTKRKHSVRQNLENWKLGVPSFPYTLLILIPLEAADMHSVDCKYGIPFFSTLHSHEIFFFQVTKVLSEFKKKYHPTEMLNR
jgi:hypothetical protein